MSSSRPKTSLLVTGNLAMEIFFGARPNEQHLRKSPLACHRVEFARFFVVRIVERIMAGPVSGRVRIFIRVIPDIDLNDKT
jgi:hypothetical protein